MKITGSFPIGTLKGVRVQIHRLFVPFLVLLVAPSALSGGLPGAIEAAGLVLATYLFILLHELGHCVAARRAGVPVLDVTLWPLGGMARMAGLPADPRAELVIAAAGPLVNLGLALVLAILGLDRLASLNLALGLFNLVPCFPLDGGRVLRAALALRLGPRLSTRLTSGTGRALVAGLAVAGSLQGHLGMALFGVFLLLVGGLEERSPGPT